jgi:DNA-binding MarR family transcriptional regulator
MPIEYDLPGSEQDLRGSRALLQHCHARRLTTQTALVLVALAKRRAGMTEDDLMEDLGLTRADVSSVLLSLNRRCLVHRGASRDRERYCLTEDGLIDVVAMVQTVLLTNE